MRSGCAGLRPRIVQRANESRAPAAPHPPRRPPQRDPGHSGARGSVPDAPGPVVVVAGPTASGKSALAAALARRFRGVVINADSVQLYDTLDIISSRPGAAALAAAPHRLYGVLAGDDPCSAGRWLRMAEREIDAALGAGRLPVVTGGTGLYLKALTEGLARVPAIDPALRGRLRRDFAARGAAALHADLAARDPEGARAIRPSDPQRILRALEVVAQTGRTLGSWQAEGAGAPPRRRFARVLLMPPRAAVHAACEARVHAMLEAGAVEEARRAVGLGLAPALPVMKAVGLAPFAALAEGRIGRAEAVRLASRDTRRYARRQATWFRRQMAADAVFEAQHSESLQSQIFSFISETLLTAPG